VCALSNNESFSRHLPTWQDRRPAALWTKPRVCCRSGRCSGLCLYGFSSKVAVKPMGRLLAAVALTSIRSKVNPVNCTTLMANLAANGAEPLRGVPLEE
jgi:hypothetical protein